MSNIKLARVDDRLIHGQVMTNWLQFTGANQIIIIDDGTAKDEFTRTVISMAVPKNVTLKIFTINDAIDFLVNEDDDKPTILLAKFPDAFLQLHEKGVKLEEVVIGGMGAKKERVKLYKNIAASERERDIMNKLIERGVHVKIQIIPDEKSVTIKSDMLKI